MKRALLLLLLMLAPAFMAACSSSDDQAKEDAINSKKEEEAKENVAKKKPLPICPQVAIVRELDTFRDYGAEKPDPSEVVAAARMQSIEGDCAYTDKDEDEGAGIDIEFDLGLVAERGPRLGGDHFDFPFFVAVVDPDGNVVDKNQLTTRFRFSGDIQKIEDKTESLHVFIPLGKKDRDRGPEYRVLAGFQLTQAQLDVVHAREAAQMRAALSEQPAFAAAPGKETPAASGRHETASAADTKPAPESTATYPAEKGAEPYPGNSLHFLKPPSDEPASAPESLQPPPAPADEAKPDQPPQ